MRNGAPMHLPLEEHTLSTPPDTPFKKAARTPTLWIVLGTLVFLLVISFVGREPAGQRMGLTEFETAIEQGRVANAVLYDGDQTVIGELSDGSEYRTTFPTEYADDLAALVLKIELPLR